MNSLDRFLVRLSFDESRRLEVYEKLRSAAQDNISLYQAVLNLVEIYSRSIRTRPLSQMFEEWAEALEAGQPFHIAVGTFVPEHERMVLSTAADGQSVVDTFIAIEKQVGASAEMRNTILAASITPVLYLILATVLLVAVATKLLPEILNSVDREVALDTSPVFIHVTEFIGAAPWFLPLVLTLAVIAYHFVKHYEFPFRKTLDKFPPFSFYHLMQGASFLMTLNGLTKVGVQQQDAVDRISERGSHWLKARCAPIVEGMYAGKKLGQACDESGFGFPSNKVIDDILFYENLSESMIAIDRAADRWLKDGKLRAKQISYMTNIVGLLGMAGVLVWIVLNVALILSKSSFLSGL